MLVNYVDSANIDSVSLSGFESLYRLGPLKTRAESLPRKDAGEKLKKMAASDYGNLYI